MYRSLWNTFSWITPYTSNWAKFDRLFPILLHAAVYKPYAFNFEISRELGKPSSLDKPITMLFS